MLIFADPLLPRVVELATTSSDRQTKASDSYIILYIIQTMSTCNYGFKVFY